MRLKLIFSFELLLLIGFDSQMGTKGLKLKTNEYKPNIVRGEHATPGEFPFIVALQSYGMFNECGGIIISESHILTAAFCVHAVNEGYYKIIAGDLDNHIDEGTEQFRYVKKITLHPNFNPYNGRMDYDVAILELTEKLAFDDHVQPAKLPHPNHQPTPGNCTSAGWGRLGGWHDAWPTKLNKIQLSYVDSKTCQAKYEELGVPLSSPVICAGDGKIDTCYGDNGGPLVCKGVLCGIISSTNCALHQFDVPDVPAYFTAVSQVLPFIQSVLSGVPQPCSGFNCNNGNCVRDWYECDGYNDCADNSDEHTSCPKCSRGFQCGSGECIEKEFECDMSLDCSDGSDEHLHCSTECDKNTHFKCQDTNMKCFPKTYQCDGYQDCRDGSDEINCLTAPFQNILGGLKKMELKYKKSLHRKLSY